ncbi:carbohydrate kinase family protein [Spiribacter halobius]|uniref:Carbohydrate kinase n=1 Tax=Sediminicurvatus halobius TaxID=2182432 RepID=A0A2U2N9G8_9GAMM|nr:carbohydrate kinase [Spiribacter halobius]PWG65738.1 carbohydrate kinase [Spiribacter halobius]UEX77774.1 carbohydrate kinase [Spiribacter halobius]
MIICCGEALIDFVPMTGADGARGYRPCIGGSPLNVAIAAARLGVPTGFLTRLSSDFFGDQLADGLAGNGVDLGYVTRAEQPSTLAFVSLAPGEEPQFAFYSENAADRSLAPEDLPRALPAAVECLQLGSISLMQEPSATTLEGLMRRESGRRVLSLDPNVRPGVIRDRRDWARRLEGWITLVDVVKVSRADLEWLYPEEAPEAVARRWQASGPALVVMTRGGDGAVAFTGHRRLAMPGRSVEVADTVGAGDAFHAGLLASLRAQGLLRREPLAAAGEAELAAALDFAGRVAAITCSRHGADPPRREEL